MKNSRQELDAELIGYIFWEAQGEQGDKCSREFGLH